MDMSEAPPRGTVAYLEWLMSQKCTCADDAPNPVEVATMAVPAPSIPFLVRLADGRTWSGAEFTPGGFVCVHTPDNPGGVCTIATSTDALLADRTPDDPLYGATVEHYS